MGATTVRRRRGALACIAVAGLAALAATPRVLAPSDLQPDETVVLFRSSARYRPATASAGAQWVVPIHAWVYEEENDSLWRRAVLAGLRRQLGLEQGAEQSELFRKRAGAFLADNERGKTLRVHIAGESRVLPATGADGHTRGTVEVPAGALKAAPDLTLRITAPDGRWFAGEAPLAPRSGITVVSDIDDTVKISSVHDHRELLRNTFLREYQAVPGLADRYDAWARAGARFEYLSSSPWQLYAPLVHFLDESGYPTGPLHLKSFRLKDERFLALFQDPEATKTPVLERLLAEHPGHRFVLVGDSGERDPELYAAVARHYPERVARIVVRELEAAPMTAARRDAAFAGLAPDLALVFRDARALPERPW